MTYLKDLIPGEVYKMTYGQVYITQCTGKDDVKDCLLDGRYDLRHAEFSSNYDWILASPEEKQQYIECKRQGKFVPLSEINLKPKYYVY